MRYIRELTRNIHSFLSYNRAERRGIFILSAILVIIIIVYIFMPFLIRQKPYDFTRSEKEIAEFFNSFSDSGLTGTAEQNRFDPNPVVEESSLFPFDPNHLPAEKWQALGLSGRQITAIQHYEEKGGRFRKKEDLAKIYTLGPELYRKLEPYIIIATEPEKGAHNGNISPLKPVPFCPDSMTPDDWMAMGMREDLAMTIGKYMAGGGQFLEKEDLKKIYGMKDQEYEILAGFFQPPKGKQGNPPLPKKSPAGNVVIELNSADTLDLQQLRGIGPSFAGRIIKYRNKLGGYARKDQLLEVYGMDTARFKMIEANIAVNPERVLKININKAGIKDFLKHPYFEFYMAKSIITHREKLGKFTRTDQILGADLIYRELFEKISPYITIE